MEDVRENVGGSSVPGSLSCDSTTEDPLTSTPSCDRDEPIQEGSDPSCNISVNSLEERLSKNEEFNSNTIEDDSSTKCSNLEDVESPNEYTNNEFNNTEQIESVELLTFSSFKSKVVYKDISSDSSMEDEGHEGTEEEEEDEDDSSSSASSQDSSSGFCSTSTGLAYTPYLSSPFEMGVMEENHQMLFSDEDYPESEESDSFLSPVDKLRRQAASLTVSTRECACGGVEEALEQVWECEAEVEALMAVVARLAEDPATGVRKEMISLIPRLVAVCRSHACLSPHVAAALLPLLLRYATQAPHATALAEALEAGLLTPDEMELVCQDITDPRHDDHEPAVTLLSRVTPLLPRASVVRHVLPRYAALCRSGVWQARRHAAQAFGAVANAAGLVHTEERLVPLFVALAHDAVWEVRMACCEALTEVSRACLPHTRAASLGCLCLQLLADRSGWVRTSAYEHLGMFLSSYAASEEQSVEPEPEKPVESPPETDFNSFNFWRMPLPTVELPKIEPVPKKGKETVLCETAGPAVQFGDILASESETSELNTSSDSTDSEDTVIDLSSMHEGLLTLDEDLEHSVELVRGSSIPARSVWGDASDFSEPPLVRFFKNMKGATQEGLDPELLAEINTVVSMQHVIPPELLKQFLLMIDSRKAEPGGNDVAFHCAYAMPAVALTLGRDNWRVLRATYAHLAKNYQWRVRRTLAHSIAIIADIIGPENTARDLLPIYSKLLETDSEVVKFGLLENMAGMVRALPACRRAEVLGLQQHFSLKDWKTREVIAAQLQLMVHQYTTREVEHYLMNYCMELLCDTVVHNRTKTLRLMSLVIERLSHDGTTQVVEKLSRDLCERFANATSWTHRQTFVLFCERLWNDGVLPPELFCEVFLPSLLKLGKDSVPNVRLALAEVLSRSFVSHTLFADDTCDVRVLYSLLQVDTDRDVRTLACSLVPEDSIIVQTFPPKDKQPFCRDVQTPNRTEETYYRIENGNLVRDDKPVEQGSKDLGSASDKDDNPDGDSNTDTSPDWW